MSQSSIVTKIGDDLEVTVNFDYTPAQKGIYHLALEDCQPAFDAEIDITEVLLNGVNILSVLSEEIVEQLEEEIMTPSDEQDDGDYADEQEYWEF